MSNQFKAGDLALIVGCYMFKENLGQVCELKRHLREGESYLTPDGVLATSPGDCWLVEGEGVTGAYKCPINGDITRTPGFALASPAHLMPLRGDFAPEQQKTKEAEPCA